MSNENYALVIDEQSFNPSTKGKSLSMARLVTSALGQSRTNINKKNEEKE